MKFGINVLYKKLSNKWEFYEIRCKRSLQKNCPINGSFMKFSINVLYKKLSNNWEFHEIRCKRSLQKIVQ